MDDNKKTTDNAAGMGKFRYASVIRKGKPIHSKFDDFSVRHPAMPLEKRAKIFSPFDALKGFNEAIASKEVHYAEKQPLNEEDTRQLDLTLNLLHQLTLNGKIARSNHVQVTITYFVACQDKENAAYRSKGIYETVSGTVLSVDNISRTVRLESGTVLTDIPMDDIQTIEHSTISGG